MIFSVSLLPTDSEWAGRFYAPEVIGNAVEHVMVGLAPRCAIDARVIFEGEEVRCGVHLEHHGGENQKEK